MTQKLNKNILSIIFFFSIFIFSRSFCYKLNGADKIAVPINTIRVFDLSYSSTETLDVNFNEVFIIKLAANPSTGYDWLIENFSLLNRNILTPLNVNESGYITEYTQPISTGLVTGAPGYEEFRFIGRNKGSVDMTFVYRELAEPRTEIRRLNVKINVN